MKYNIGRVKLFVINFFFCLKFFFFGSKSFKIRPTRELVQKIRGG